MQTVTQNAGLHDLTDDGTQSCAVMSSAAESVSGVASRYLKPDAECSVDFIKRRGVKLRVLLVITRMTVGGDTNVVLDIARYFRHHPWIEAEIAAGPVQDSEIDLTHLAREEQIPMSLIPSLSNSLNPQMMVRAIFDLNRLIRRGRYDVVHTHSSAAGILGRVAAVTARVPIIVHHVHGWGVQDDMPPLLRSTYLNLERACAIFTQRLVAVSEPTITKGLTYRIGCKSKFSLIYNGIDLHRFSQPADSAIYQELALDRGRKFVGMIGRLDRQKNPLDFIRAAAIVQRRCENAQFIIAGDGALRPACEQLIDELHLRRNCILLGFRSDISRILPLISVMSSTSLWEGLPVAFQEAMCAGIPIAAYDVDGVSDVVRDGQTGYLIPPRNVEVLAERIMELLVDDDLRRKLAENARVAAVAFSTERMLQQIENLYTQLALSRGEAQAQST